MRHGWAERALVALGLLAATAWEAGGSEFHYALVFGAESHPKRAREAHSWAIFVRAVGEGPDPADYAVETRVISWLPETRRVKTHAPSPEPGRNLSNPETFAAVLGYESRVAMWGPFLIDRELYDRASQVSAIFDHRLFQSRAFATTRTPGIANCIHAVADVDNLFGANHRPRLRVGKPASRFLAEKVANQALADPGPGNHAWLIPRLGLDRYPIDVAPAPRVAGRNCPACRPG